LRSAYEGAVQAGRWLKRERDHAHTKALTEAANRCATVRAGKRSGGAINAAKECESEIRALIVDTTISMGSQE
jgi:hypothetical protein